jgi:dTDP-4-amino-4,6-dideoxygalactose transaminase
MIPFIDLEAQKARLGDSVERAIKRVLDHGKFIMGPEIGELEQKLAAFTGAKYAISCSSGTDALLLALMAKGVGEVDAVFVPSFTFVSTAEVVVLTGATPIFVDVLPETFNICPESLERGIDEARKLGLTPKCVIPVDLFGLPADYNAIKSLAEKHGLWVLADAAQSFGGTYHGKRVGSLAEVTATSFFPAKPLGCYGDGGAVFTDDKELASVMESIRVHGKGADKYDNVRVGVNARLDTIQAAVLIEKLGIYEDEIERRQSVARYYQRTLAGFVQVPLIPQSLQSVWAQYTVVLPENAPREEIMQAMHRQGVPTMVYYPKPLHLQTAYKHFPKADKQLKVSESLASRVLSLPMHPYLENDVQDRIVGALAGALEPYSQAHTKKAFA